MRIESLKPLTQEGLRRWAKEALQDEMVFDAIGGLPEHWSWIWFLLRESQDRSEWFPSGKWATIQAIEMYLVLEARSSLGVVQPSGLP